MAKTGRNSPCPCGSGKKYKKCCLAKEAPPVDLLWHRLSKAHDDLMDRLVAFVRTRLEDNVLAVAAADFLLWPDDEVPDEEIDGHLPLFMPWFLFNWRYDLGSTDVELDIQEDVSIVGIYLSDHAHHLDDLQVRLAEAAMDKPFSFVEVTACEPGRGFTLQDILTGTQTEVVEQTASEMVKVGDMLLAKVVTVDHVSILMGCGTIAIRPSWKAAIIHLRQQMKKQVGAIDDAVVLDYDIEIRDLYLDIHDAALQPPRMTNTDGDPIVLHTLNYEIDDPEAAFEKLCGLAAAVETPEELKASAVLDAQGRVAQVEIPWARAGHKKDEALGDTLLGRLAIDGHRLRAEVNSAIRADLIFKEIEKRMGSAARHLGTETQTLEEMWPTDEDDFDGDLGPMPDEDLKDFPEVRDHLVSTVDTHWKGWINEKIPALGGQTPRQAAKTADGRESVEALLLEARRAMERDGMLALFDDDPIEQVRRRLGLNRPLPSLSGSGREAFEKIYGIIASFGMRNDMQHITELAARLCRRLDNGDEFSLTRGRPEIWAAAILYVVAQLNFIFDPENPHHMTAEALCDDLGTKPSTVCNKALRIRKDCDIRFGDPEYSLPEMADMFSVYETKDGFIVP